MAVALSGTVVEQAPFGWLSDGREVCRYTLDNRQGTKVSIINYGSIITALEVSDRNGEPVDVVLGYDRLTDYIRDEQYLGAIVGRYANRIAGGIIHLNGKSYRLSRNHGEHHLHGGFIGFSKVLWAAESTSAGPDQSLVLRYRSPAGEEGYPGNLQVEVHYELTRENELRITFEARTDAPTCINLTAHPYFNLNGAGNGRVETHLLKIDADNYLPIDSDFIPTGIEASVENTPLDFRSIRLLGARLDEPCEQLQIAAGYDHTLVVNRWDRTLRPVAVLANPDSGIRLSLEATLPGVQLYTANYLPDGLVGKNNRIYGRRSGVCLEPQFFSNSPNLQQFPSTLLSPEEVYRHSIVYRFDHWQ